MVAITDQEHCTIDDGGRYHQISILRADASEASASIRYVEVQTIPSLVDHPPSHALLPRTGISRHQLWSPQMRKLFAICGAFVKELMVNTRLFLDMTPNVSGLGL